MSQARGGERRLIQAGIVTREHRGARGVTDVVVHEVLDARVVLCLAPHVDVYSRLNEVCICECVSPILLHVQWTCG